MCMLLWTFKHVEVQLINMSRHAQVCEISTYQTGNYPPLWRHLVGLEDYYI